MGSRKKAGQLLESAAAKHKAGQLSTAEALYRQALAEDPQQAQAHFLLGSLEFDRGRFDAAIALFERVVELQPRNPNYLNSLGIALRRQQRAADARAAFERALALKPNMVEAHYNLGLTLDALGDLAAAAASYRRAVTHRPDSLPAQLQLCNLLNDCAEYERAHAAVRDALKHHPEAPALHNTLGTVAKNLGLLDESVAAYRRALELKPDYRVAHSNLVYTLAFHPDYDAARILDEARGYARVHASAPGEPAAHANDRDPERKLRIGYVSPDFREHVQAQFMLPLLAHHDRERFEVFCYAGVRSPDAVTARLRELSSTWRSIESLADADVEALVREDRIDILVDLTMHMARNRLSLFARRPAPVQATWLAYPGTTGLSSIDFRLTDPHLDPPELEPLPYAERSLRLAETFWCYDPRLDPPPEPGPLPALERGAITFGCLNNFCKVNAGVLELWARVLHAVPQSRLLVLVPEGEARTRVHAALRDRGVLPARVDFVGYETRARYFAEFKRIDISLDTLPYNGHTTSLDSFYMGVPVVTLVGTTVAGRAGLSQARNLGLPELIAENPDEYVARAGALAGDLTRLAELRLTLRERLERSPLMAAGRFARNLEAAYRDMWRDWCGGAGTGGATPPSAA